MVEYELVGIPERYGTRKCYDCGAEPSDGEIFMERFVILHDKPYSVPECDSCREFDDKKNYTKSDTKLTDPVQVAD